MPFGFSCCGSSLVLAVLIASSAETCEGRQLPLLRELESNDSLKQLHVLQSLFEDIGEGLRPQEDAARYAGLYGQALLALAGDFGHPAVQVEAAALLAMMAETGTEAADALARVGARSSVIETLIHATDLPDDRMMDVAEPLSTVLHHLPRGDEAHEAALARLGDRYNAVQDRAAEKLINELNSDERHEQLRTLRGIPSVVKKSKFPEKAAAEIVGQFGPAILGLVGDFDHREVQVEAATVLQQVAETGTEAAEALARLFVRGGTHSSLVDTLSRTLELPDSDMEDIVRPLTAILKHLPWIYGPPETATTILPLFQLLDHSHSSVKNAAVVMLARIPVHTSPDGSCAVTAPGLADALVNHGGVEKLSALLLSSDNSTRDRAAVLLFTMAVTRICEDYIVGRKSGLSPTAIVTNRILPNAFKGLDCMPLVHAVCSSLLFEGDEGQRRYAVDNGCLEAACTFISTPISGGLPVHERIEEGLITTLLLAFKEILRDSDVLGQEVAKTIVGSMRCQQSIEYIARSPDANIASSAAQAVTNTLSVYAADLRRRTTTGETLSSPWAPWIGGGILLVAVASVLWWFLQPHIDRWNQSREQRQAEDTAAQLIAEEEAERSRGQGRGQRGHARQPNASASRRPTAQPSSAAADDDSESASTATPSTRATSSSDLQPPTMSGDGSADQHQVEAMADSGGQWTQTTEGHRKKKGRKGGRPGRTGGSALRPEAGLPSSSHLAAPPQQAPNDFSNGHPMTPPSSSPTRDSEGHPSGDLSTATSTADQTPRDTLPMSVSIPKRGRAAGRGLGLPTIAPPPPSMGAAPPTPWLPSAEDISSSTAHRPPLPPPPPPPPSPPEVSCGAALSHEWPSSGSSVRADDGASRRGPPPLVKCGRFASCGGGGVRRPVTFPDRSPACPPSSSFNEGLHPLPPAAAGAASSSASMVDCLVCFGEHGPAAVMYIPCRHMHICTTCYANRKQAWQRRLGRVRAENADRKRANVVLAQGEGAEQLELLDEPEYRCEQCSKAVDFAGTMAEALQWVSNPFISQPE
ncbi:unnamed protein product [Vitrella brassicaformis CCMP3155]|uniref:RING-type domain-containing protein n=1 Tax=Vitrella brassicaformis (strain CCMP3155) TaxID=1169540 RepID=A0A0G4GVA3_VITBC|nr:unnamed protein product [Vitrella brassicaformis CCMP3155]|eukprot:CEM34799.1 unnamed protein product [Vitrella brassicaformis CCMP3155]